MLSSSYGKQQNFQEAWHHKDPEEREVCQNSIQNKSGDMINKEVWRKPKRKNMPPNRCLIDSKLVLKKKMYGQVRELLFSRGYTQIPEVGFY